MLSKKPQKAIELTDHNLSTSAVDETADAPTYSGGNKVLEGMNLKFTDSDSKTITLYIVDTVNGTEIQIFRAASNKNQNIVENGFDGLIIPDKWLPKLTISQTAAPSNTHVSGYVLVKNAD